MESEHSRISFCRSLEEEKEGKEEEEEEEA